MYYYKIDVVSENYSIALQSEIELDNREVLNLAKIEDKFQEEWDADDVDIDNDITEVTKNEFIQIK